MNEPKDDSCHTCMCVAIFSKFELTSTCTYIDLSDSNKYFLFLSIAYMCHQ